MAPVNGSPAHLTTSLEDVIVSPLHSEQETDSDDDQILRGSRTSAEIRTFDRGLLQEEEERDEIISRSLKKRGSVNSLKRQNSFPGVVKSALGKAYNALPKRPGFNDHSGGEGENDPRRELRRDRRRRKKAGLKADAMHGEDGTLMYEMEEGGLKEGSSTGSSSDNENSSEFDRKELGRLGGDRVSKKRHWKVWLFVHVLIGLLFAILTLGAWRLSMGRSNIQAQAVYNNGTALFAPTTILISLDGFRADFLQRGLTPRLSAFVEEGISPVYMLPSFPSVTFPNHYTLVTGLYPESHGVVGNTFWDPAMREDFFYTDSARSMQGKWWGGEPLWVTAEQQGIRTAVHMWPGSEAHIMDVEPSFLDVYNGKELLANKADRILQLLDKPGLESKETVAVSDMRPQLIAAYVPNVDADGHEFGPNSTEIRTTINEVDKMLDRLFIGLEARNLTKVVNVVVVSDHGMATTSTDRLIQLDDIIDMSKIERTDGWPLYGLRPKDPEDLQHLYDTLSEEAKSNPGFQVYLKDVNMPERWHFSKNERIAPLWIIPLTGWAIVTKKEFNVEEEQAKGGVYHPRGLHGYDHENPLMRAIFIARGPAFPHQPNSRVEPFQNIEVYNIVCDSLGLTPRPNNGTLRLPLKPVGTHSSDTLPAEPLDLSASTTADEVIDPAAVISISPIEVSSAADSKVIPPHLVGVNPPDPDVSPGALESTGIPTTLGTPPQPQASSSPKPSEEKQSWWDLIVGEIDEFKTWAGSLIDKAGT